MSLLCIDTPEGRQRRNLKYLVHDLRSFEESVQNLFELSADCLHEAESSSSCLHEEESHDSSRALLFSHKAPVPKMGRQTYKMWKATLELSTGLVFKSDLLDKPKTLHFYPLERFPEAITRNFQIPGFDLTQFLAHFLQRYFPGLNVRLEPLHDLNREDLGVDLVSRFHQKTKRKQFLVTDLCAKLHGLTRTPQKDFILGFTWTDLYPKEELNFVLGEASFQHRCAVLSFGRYEPLSYETKDDSSDAVDDTDEENLITVDGKLLWKLIRVATHETSHLFGLNHCVFFDCSMNESKSVAEALAQPLVLCPVCLRKMQRFLKFDVKERYQGLRNMCQMVQDVYPSDDMKRTIQWLHRCLEFLN